MKRMAVAALTLATAAAGGGPALQAPAQGRVAAQGGASADAPAGVRVWRFDGDQPGAAPTGFAFGLTGEGARGRWEVMAEPGAPSGAQVLAQLDADDTDNRFPVAVTAAPMAADARVSVRCKTVSGVVDQACGVVLRYQDASNYYVARANALEGNVRFYFVKDGKRRQLASWSGEVESATWHRLGLEARGDRFTVHWNGATILDVHDSTFAAAGLAGVWTKADSVTYFDDFEVAPL
jgi:hypothetical protein